MKNRIRCICTTCIFVLAAGHTALAATTPTAFEYRNTIGIKLVRIERGSFMMGFGENPVPDAIATLSDEKDDKPKPHAINGNPDEYPNHKVTIKKTFYIGAYEVTNAQYEQYDPEHRRYRGAAEQLKTDDSPVTMVSWDDAVGFCKWLSEKEGLPYRLPTEAEWEYACRAGTTGHFYTGDSPPERNSAANKWGLFNMHGVAEEWCYDWYGPYEQGPQTDPVGRVDGDFKVTRGGSYSTATFYRRSANRSGTITDDKSPLVGFRVVLGKLPNTKALPPVKQPYQQNVKQDIPRDISKGPNPNAPYLEIRSYINIDKGSQGPLFYYHNHNPDIVQCPNGDLFAIHFSTNSEGDREMVYGGSRLRYDNKQWDKSSVVWGPPDRKAEYSVLWVDGGIVYNFSSLGVGNSRPGAIVMRSSRDNCATWSKTRTIVVRADEQGVMENVFRTSKGAIVIPADDHNLFVSYDNGITWASPCNAKGPAGIHTPMMELRNGDLMAYGRYGDIDGKMPKSVSSDMGKTWTVSKSPFSGIGGGQRATLLRLKEGPIFFSSFAKKPMMMSDGKREQSECKGLYAAISFDEGKSWPVMQLISDGSGREVFTRKNKYYKMEKSKSEGNGYLASCQSADCVIHVVSNRSEYVFNLKWLWPGYQSE